MTDIVDKDRTVRGLTDDPEGWTSPINRAIAHMARSLLEQGVSSHIVYDAIAAVPTEGRNPWRDQ